MLSNKFLPGFVIITIITCNTFAGSLTGVVNYNGKPMPKNKQTQLKKLTDDPECGSKHKTPVYRQALIVNENKTLKNTLIYLKNVKYDGEVTKEPALLDQSGCLYSPHVMGVMANQPVTIRNSDATILHNAHTLPKINTDRNLAMPLVMDISTTFEKSESPFVIKCDVHPWMKAYVAVFDHPYFAVTDDTGKFKIEKIPAGEYEVVAWHERDAKYLGYTQTKTINITDENHSLNFELTKGEKKKK